MGNKFACFIFCPHNMVTLWYSCVQLGFNNFTLKRKCWMLQSVSGTAKQISGCDEWQLVGT